MVEVVDLGVNVAPERFVDEAVAHEAQVIAISSMMVHTAKGENGCLKVRQLLRERGWRAVSRSPLAARRTVSTRSCTKPCRPTLGRRTESPPGGPS